MYLKNSIGMVFMMCNKIVFQIEDYRNVIDINNDTAEEIFNQECLKLIKIDELVR